MQILVLTFNRQWIQDEENDVERKIFPFVSFAELGFGILQEPFSAESDH